MRVFHCDHCRSLVFFENSQCLACDHVLAFLPDRMEMRSLRPAEGDYWQVTDPKYQGPEYRLCQNYRRHNVCNWAVAADDQNDFCLSCRLTHVIPDLEDAAHRQAWYLLEQAKRRLVYSLLDLKLPVSSKSEDPEHGLAFEFLADSTSDDGSFQPVLTGHDDGVITISIAEADDAVREQRRIAMHEPYRTLLGHFRHEIGHYYWDRLIRDDALLETFRELFGDETVDYAAALQTHYQHGPSANWQSQYISAYAGSHPWEDWAETWAHYLHMFDTLETARESGFALLPKRGDTPQVRPDAITGRQRATSFDSLMDYWCGVTYLLNNLNRGLGLKDGYPFVLSPPVVEKLRFVHQVCCDIRRQTQPNILAGQSR